MSSLACRVIGLLAVATLTTVLSVNSNAQECPLGCVKICNETEVVLAIATIRKDGEKDAIEMIGWYNLKPGVCFKPKIGMFWENFYSVKARTPDGKEYYPEYKQDKALLDGDSAEGMSGYSGFEVCVTTAVFNRNVGRNFKDAFSETCPAGYHKAKVNLYTRGSHNNGRGGVVSTFSLK